MAKRKRLTPAQANYLGSGPVSGGSAPETRSMPLATAPIAQVAGEASARAALADLAGAVETARAEGRLLEALPLDEIDDRHLFRDRMVQDEEEMRALLTSLRARGQQMPIEVVRLEGGDTPYGLISGWRRLTALRRLRAEDDDPRFATVRAMVIAPDTAQAAYQAMVEENEIRVNLSLYERARIAVRAMHEHVYPTQRAALQGLFANATRSKRSKIGSFIALVEAFDSVLRFPTAISEKLGLALTRELVRDPGFRSRVFARLQLADPQTPAEELRVLSAVVEQARPPESAPEPGAPPAVVRPAPPEPASPRPRVRVPGDIPLKGERLSAAVGSGLSLNYTPGDNRIELFGAAVDSHLWEELQDWLKARR